MRTFLFADLRDYTTFVETRGDAATAKLLKAFRAIVRAAVATTRGAEIRTEGDSFYVVFPTPSAAMRCAIRIQRDAWTHTRKHAELGLAIGIGVNTGEAVVHDRGYVGSAVIVAARLAQQAAAGQVLVTETVRSLVRTSGLAPLRDVGAWTLKGVSEPLRVFEVDLAVGSTARALAPALGLPAMLQGTPVSTTSGLVVCPELVQRESALATLLEHVRAASTGESRIVAVSGEGGVGKSRLVRELARLALPDGFYVFGGRSQPTGAPYEPFIAALRPYAHRRGAEILKKLLGALAVELRRLLPEVEIADPTASTGTPDEERRERFLRTIQLLLEDAAAQRPVLLVLEDFHDADVASRDLLLYLATNLRVGICTLVTFRDEEVGPAHPLRALLTDLDRERRLARVHLLPLDGLGVMRMTAAMLPGRDVSTLAHAVFDRSEGVPFYVEELLKTALDSPDTLSLPRTVADSVRLRVTRLVDARGAGVAEMLETAAVAAVPLGYDVLARLSGRPEAEFAADLAAAIDAQLLERPPTRTELYQFRHALTREALETGISPARKRRLHARVAAAFEALGDANSRATLLARHFAAAGVPEKALNYARKGAEHAISVGAYGGAIDLLRDAVVMASGMSEESDVMEELAVALQAAGRAAEAEETIQRARELARGARDHARIARLDIRLGAVLQMLGRRADAMSVTKRAISGLESQPGPLLAEAVALQASLAYAENDAEQANALAKRALALRRGNIAARVRVSALTTLGAAGSRTGNARWRDKLEEAIRLGVETDQPTEVANAYLELSRALQLRGDWDGARMAAQEGAEISRSSGVEFAQAALLAQLAFVLITQGRYREARHAAEQAAAIAPANTVVCTAAKTVLADALTMLGDHATALVLHEELTSQLDRADPERRVFMLGSRARAELGLDRVDDAWRSAKAGIALAGSVLRGTGITAFLIAGDVAEARRDPSAAREVLKAFEHQFVGRDSPHIRVVRAELAAILATCEGAASASAFSSVARQYEALGVPVRAAYRRGTAAIARAARSGGSASARAELEAVRAELMDRGALRYVSAIDAALARKGRDQRPTEILGERDLRVAHLLADGLTDTRIAAEVGISTRQASAAIARLKATLGVSRRSQVAAWAVRRARTARSAAAYAV